MYAIVAHNHHVHTKNDPQRITKLIPYIKYYDWDDIGFPAGPGDYSTFQKKQWKICT